MDEGIAEFICIGDLRLTVEGFFIFGGFSNEPIEKYIYLYPISPPEIQIGSLYRRWPLTR